MKDTQLHNLLVGLADRCWNTHEKCVLSRSTASQTRRCQPGSALLLALADRLDEFRIEGLDLYGNLPYTRGVEVNPQ